MIKHPEHWNLIGRKFSTKLFINTLKEVLLEIPCNTLSYSGGIDSSLLLYTMFVLGKEIRTFTVTCHDKHPDIEYSMLGLKYLENRFGRKTKSSEWLVIKNAGNGDSLVSAFYNNLKIRGIKNIVAGDGIDEFMCGYYNHQKGNPDNQYYRYMWKLQAEQLEPLNSNSHDIEVYLPYLDSRMLSLYAGIPIKDKVNHQQRKRILLKIAKDILPNEIIGRKKYGFATEYKE